MFQPTFRPIRILFPALLSLLLPVGGCSLSSENDELPAEDEQVQTVNTSALEEELQALQRRVEFLEDKLVPGKKVEPALPAPSAPSRPKSEPAAKKTASASPPAPSAPATPVPPVMPSGDMSADSGKPGALPSPYSPAPAQETAGLPLVSGTPSLPRVTESTPATPVPITPPTSAPAKTEQNAYDMALELYRTGRFAQAETAFRAFLEAYPNSRLTPNALYWRGETFYSRGMFSDAIFAFKDVQARFPRHAKTPDSLLKTAMAYSKLGDKQNAELHLTVLREDWPKSEAATRAKQLGLF